MVVDDDSTLTLLIMSDVLDETLDFSSFVTVRFEPSSAACAFVMVARVLLLSLDVGITCALSLLCDNILFGVAVVLMFFLVSL